MSLGLWRTSILISLCTVFDLVKSSFLKLFCYRILIRGKSKHKWFCIWFGEENLSNVMWGDFIQDLRLEKCFKQAWGKLLTHLKESNWYDYHWKSSSLWWNVKNTLAGAWSNSNLFDLLEEGSVTLAVSPLRLFTGLVFPPFPNNYELSAVCLSAVSSAADARSQGAQMSP